MGIQSHEGMSWRKDDERAPWIPTLWWGIQQPQGSGWLRGIGSCGAASQVHPCMPGVGLNKQPCFISSSWILRILKTLVMASCHTILCKPKIKIKNNKKKCSTCALTITRVAEVEGFSSDAVMKSVYVNIFLQTRDWLDKTNSSNVITRLFAIDRENKTLKILLETNKKKITKNQLQSNFFLWKGKLKPFLLNWPDPLVRGIQSDIMQEQCQIIIVIWEAAFPSVTGHYEPKFIKRLIEFEVRHSWNKNITHGFKNSSLNIDRFLNKCNLFSKMCCFVSSHMKIRPNLLHGFSRNSVSQVKAASFENFISALISVAFPFQVKHFKFSLWIQ